MQTVPENQTKEKDVAVFAEDARFSQAVMWAVEMMDHDPWQPKLQVAKDLVLAGRVDLAAHTVTSSNHTYWIDAEHGCTCQDAQFRSRYCKHFVAYDLAKRAEIRMNGHATNPQLHIQPPPPTNSLGAPASETPGAHPDPVWLDAIDQVSCKALEALPAHKSVIAKAVAMISGARGTCVDGLASICDIHGETFEVERLCTCADAQKAEGRWCAHRMAYALISRAEIYMNDNFPTTPQPSEPIDISDPALPMALSPAEPPTALPAARTVLSHQGHTLKDANSTCCIKQFVGPTEVMWTFRGQDDTDVWARAQRGIKAVQQLAHQVMPPPAQPAPAQPAPAQPAQPAQPANGEKAVNHGIQSDSPWCQQHGVFHELWIKGNRRWHSHKDPLAPDKFCNFQAK